MAKDIIVEDVRREKTRPSACQRESELSSPNSGFYRIYDIAVDQTKYVILLPTTAIEEGDEYYDNIKWVQTRRIGDLAGKFLQYRRPLKSNG